MTAPNQDFSLLVSNREFSLVLGMLNGIVHVEGKMVLIMVDKNDWVLRVTLNSDSLSATIVNAQRCHPLLDASIMITALKVENRIEKSRLTVATTGDKSSVHVKRCDPSSHGSFEDVVTTPWRYLAEYEGKKTVLDTRRYTAAPIGDPIVNTDNTGSGNIRFDFPGGASLTCYISRSLTKTEILSKCQKDAIITHTRLSRRSGGFHTTHASAIMGMELMPPSFRDAFSAEARLYMGDGTVVDLDELLAGGEWTSSTPVKQTPPLAASITPEPKRGINLMLFDDEDNGVDDDFKQFRTQRNVEGGAKQDTKDTNKDAKEGSIDKQDTKEDGSKDDTKSKSNQRKSTKRSR